MTDERWCSSMKHSWNNPLPSGKSRRMFRSNHRSGKRKTNMFQSPLRRLAYSRSSRLISLTLEARRAKMVTIGQGSLADREGIQRLIAEYHSSEGLTPIKERIAWAVDRQLQNQSPGLLLVAREKGTMVAVALAVYTPSAELGRVMTVNDFFVRPDHR